MTKNARNRAIAKAVLAGKYDTLAELGQRYGLGEAAVRYILKQRGVAPLKGRTRRLPDFARIKREYVAGWAPTVLAQRHGHSSETVRRELLLAGLPIRPASDYMRTFTDAEEARMGALYETGATLAEISLEFGTGDKSQIGRILERIGVPRRTMKESRDLRGTWKTGPRRSTVEWP